MKDFLTRRRVHAYPTLTFAVLALVAIYDRLSGHGLVNGIDGAFGGDFMSFYTGGAFVRRGTAHLLANPDAQYAFQKEILQANVPGISIWVSPPYFAWLFAPVSSLPYAAAYVTWTAVMALGVTLSFRALSKDLSLSLSAAAMWWVAARYYPTLQWFLNGQMTGLWITVLTFVFLLLRRGRDFTAGLLLGSFACKPPLALGIAVALVVSLRLRSLAGAALSASALVAIGFLTLPDAMHAYLHQGQSLLALVRDPGYHTSGLHGSFEFALLLFDGFMPRLSVVLGAATVLAFLAAIASTWFRVPWNPGEREWDLRMAATLALGVVGSPHLYGYDLMLLVLPLFIVVRHFPGRDDLPLDGDRLFTITAAVWALGLLGPVLSVLQQEVTKKVFGVSAALQCGVIAIAIFAVYVRKLASSPDSRPPGARGVSSPSVPSSPDRKRRADWAEVE